MSLADAKARILLAHRELVATWHRVESRWTDENAQRFGRNVIAPLDSAVRTAASQIEHMESEIEQMKRDCELDQRI